MKKSMKMQQLRHSLLGMTAGLLLGASCCRALEFQYKFIIPSMQDRPTAGKIFSLVDSVKGVLDVDIDFSRQALIFSFDDDYTDEEKIRGLLEKNNYKVRKIMLLEEPREGIMN